MPSNIDDWDDEPGQSFQSNSYDDWDEPPKKATRKQSFTDTWGDDDDTNNKKETTYFDDWEVEPKKTTQASYDDWDDEPVQNTKKSSKKSSADDDWDDEPVKNTSKKSSGYDDWDDEPATTSKKTTKTSGFDDWDDEPVKTTSKKSSGFDDWDDQPTQSTSQSQSNTDFSFDDWGAPATSSSTQKEPPSQDDPFEDWTTPSKTESQKQSKSQNTPEEDEWSTTPTKKPVLKTTHVTDNAKTKVYKTKLSLAEMEAQKYNIRGKKGRISHQASPPVATSAKSDDDDDWDDNKKTSNDDDDDDFDWSQPVRKTSPSRNQESYEENSYNSDSQWSQRKQSQPSFGNILSSIQTSYNNPQELKRNLYSAGKILNSAAGSMFSSLSNWVSNTVSSLNTEAPITIGGKIYQIKKKLGEGGFAIVYLATEHKENEVFSFNAPQEEEYAIKKIICKNDAVIKDTEREIHILQACKSKFVLDLIGYTSIQDNETGDLNYYLLTPYYSQGTVWSIIEYYNKEYTKIWPFSEKRCLTIFKSICLGAKHMHEKGYCHRDIKPHNVMLTTDSKGREYGVLIDLGSARPIDIKIETRQQANDLKEMSEKYCSAAYRAPELYDPRRGMHLGECLDVWSLGCTLYAMAFGTSPFESSIEGVMTLAILDGKVPFPPNNTYHCATFSKPFCKFIKMMLNPNYEERIDLDDVLNKTDLLLSRCE